MYIPPSLFFQIISPSTTTSSDNHHHTTIILGHYQDTTTIAITRPTSLSPNALNHFHMSQGWTQPNNHHNHTTSVTIIACPPQPSSFLYPIFNFFQEQKPRASIYWNECSDKGDWRFRAVVAVGRFMINGDFWERQGGGADFVASDQGG